MAEDPGRQGDRTSWQDNFAVIIGILSVAVVAIRLMGVARGDPAIAYAILQSGGTSNVLIGTLVSTLGLLAIPTAVALFFYAIRTEKAHTLPRHILLTAAFGMLYVSIYTAALASFVVAILVVIAVAIIRLIWPFAQRLIWRMPFVQNSEEKPEEKWKWRGTTFLSVGICIYVSVVAGYEMFSPAAWLPVQAISVAGQRPFSGYVLSQADGNTSILTSNPDGVISVHSQSVQATQCTPRHYEEEQATIVYVVESWFQKITNYPSCPSTRYSQSSPARPTPSSPSPSLSPSPTGSTPPAGLPS